MSDSDDFKKKIEELAKQREEKLNQKISEDVLARQRLLELKKQSIFGFEKFRTEIVYPSIVQIKSAFEKNGDVILVWDNERAENLSDRMRRFFQIFFYPKGKPYNIVGKNTSSLMFELNETNGEVTITTTTKPIFTAPTLETKKVDELNTSYFQDKLFTFLQKVTSL